MPAPLPRSAPATDVPAPSGNYADGGLAAGWALLHEAGDAIAAIAHLQGEPIPIAPRDFAMRAAAAGPVRLAATGQAIDDCAAALHTGLTALIAASGQGRDCTAASLTLWHEFDRARAGLLAMIATPH